jgi:hypothetical protein
MLERRVSLLEMLSLFRLIGVGFASSPFLFVK